MRWILGEGKDGYRLMYLMYHDVSSRIAKMYMLQSYESIPLSGCEECGDSNICDQLHIGSICSFMDNVMA